MDNIKSFASIKQAMDQIEDESMDSYSGYSDTEKYENYMHIINTLKFFENNGHITKDWMEHHRWVIEKWRDWIDNYSVINEDVTSKDFRKACSDAETLVAYLIRSIRATSTFDTKVYYILLNKMKYICDTLFDGDDIEELMNRMSLK
jgi:hypothetical protein